MKKKTTLLIAGLLLGSHAFTQYNPISYMTINVQENAGISQTNYQVNLTVNTAAEVSAGRMAADGRDIRFSDALCSSTFYDYWIESGMNSGSTSIWVTVPSIPASGTAAFLLLSGDSSVVAASNFNAVFPAALVTGGMDVTLSGTNNPGWLQVDAGDTLFIQAGTLLDISARKAIIDGVVYGQGRGYQAVTGGMSAGTGPGGGTAGTSSGASGGSYGGVGGTGGYDSGDPVNSAPAAYGTNNGFDIDMGSSGGSASAASGGNGGGGFNLNAEWISVNGVLNMNGGGAFQPGGGQGGGGGAGGGIMLTGNYVDINGTLSAVGGIGSTGTSTANDDGGGGAGGRIKVIWETMFNNNGTSDVTGGAPGIYGTGAGPTAGSVGTIFDGMNNYNGVTLTVGVPTAINGSPTPDLASLPTENGQCSVTPTVPTATSACGAMIPGTPDVSFPITTIGTTVVTWTYDDGAGNTSTQQQTVVVVGPNTGVTQNGGTLSADLGGATYQWIDCATNAPIAGATNQSFTPTVDGSYAVIVTDVCSDTSTCFPMTPSGLNELGVQQFSVYPNPAETNITVQWEAQGLTAVEARLIDLQGRVAKTTVLEAESSEISISELQSGIYLLELWSANTLLGSLRIVKR